MKYKVWDKEIKDFWKEDFTLLELAASHRFPSNAAEFYEIVPVTESSNIKLDKIDVSLLESINYQPKYLHLGKSPMEAITRVFRYIDDGLAKLDIGNIISITLKGKEAIEEYYDEPTGVGLADFMGDHPTKRIITPRKDNQE